MKIFVLSGLILAVLAASSARAATTSACPLTAGEQQVAFPRAAPPALVAAVNRDLAPYALPGQPFSVGDAVSGPNPPPFRRLIRVRRLGARWVVAYEQGGIAHMWMAAAYVITGANVSRAGSVTARGDAICEPAEQLLRGRTGGK